MAIPSIAMIPSGYKENKVYSVLPTDGSGDLDFARTTTATRINSEGLIEDIGIGKPRLNYADGVCPSLLLEPSSTNRVINSAEGVYGSAPASSTNTISPDGTNNAYIPLPNSTSNRYEQTIPAGTYATGQKLTYSWYRKRISTPTVDSFLGDLNVKSLVNLTELEVSNARQIETNINGFDRFEAVVQVIDGSLSSIFRAYFGPVVGVGNSSVAYWGHQFEALDYATSLIITTGTAQTRTADSASKTGISSLINSSEGVFYAEISALSNDGGLRRLSLSDGTNDNRVFIGFGSTINTFQFFISSSNSTVVSQVISVTDVTEYAKVAISYKLNDVGLWINGSKVGTETVATMPSSLNSLAFNQGNGGFPFEGNCKDLRVYKKALTDAELTTLTTL